MATLFERLVGNSEDGTDSAKIGLHAFRGLLLEYAEGEATGDDIAAELGLNAAQRGQLNVYLAAVDGHAEPMVIVQRLFDWLVLGEQSTQPQRFRSMSYVHGRMNAEVARNPRP